MGVITWSQWGNTAYINLTSPVSVSASSNTVSLPNISIKGNISDAGPTDLYYWYLGTDNKTPPSYHPLKWYIGATEKGDLTALCSTAVYNNVYNTASWSNISTSDIFTSNNSTTRTVAITVKAPSGASLVGYYEGYTDNIYNDSEKTILTANITLNVPPTATISAISYDTGYIYSGLTTASITVSDSSAYYGGNISSVEFTIGSQTDTLAGDGTLSIALANPGTFTPTVTITDSRGQTKTYSLDPITVNTYTAPTLSFDVDRTDSTGTPDDEGTYGLIEATLTFSDVVADAVAPSVVVTDENGTQTTPTVTWYTDNTLQTTVTWANVSSGDTVYGLFSGLNTNYSYSVSVRPRDSQGTGTAITQTISSAFYTIDFLAGGHGIAFGKPASVTGFECAMAAAFENTVDVDGVLSCNNDVLIDLPNYQTSGTTDYDIYTAIVALGWDSEVIV